MNGSLVLLFALNIADIVLTKHLVDLGAVELNPIISYLLSLNFAWAVLFKIAVSISFTLIAIAMREHIASMRLMVAGANIFLALLVAYQLVGIIVLS